MTNSDLYNYNLTIVNPPSHLRTLIRIICMIHALCWSTDFICICNKHGAPVAYLVSYNNPTFPFIQHPSYFSRFYRIEGLAIRDICTSQADSSNAIFVRKLTWWIKHLTFDELDEFSDEFFEINNKDYSFTKHCQMRLFNNFSFFK